MKIAILKFDDPQFFASRLCFIGDPSKEQVIAAIKEKFKFLPQTCETLVALVEADMARFEFYKAIDASVYPVGDNSHILEA